MHGLEMPESFSGAGVKRDGRVSKEVLPDAVGAVMIEFAGPCRNVGDAALLIDSQLVPVDASAGARPQVLGPRLVYKFAGRRNGVNRPGELARAHVVRMDIAGHVGVVAAAAH